MPIETKLEKADDVIEQFWTGKGLNVKAGQKVAQNEFASWYTIVGEHADVAFRNMLLGKLSQEGYFHDGPIYRLEDASLTSVGFGKDYHELDFRIDYTGPTKYGRLDRFRLGVGAEFNKNADGTHNLKIFLKKGNMRLVLNPEWKQNPRLAEAVAKDFRLMYGLLQETGYLAKEE